MSLYSTSLLGDSLVGAGREIFIVGSQSCELFIGPFWRLVRRWALLAYKLEGRNEPTWKKTFRALALGMRIGITTARRGFARFAPT